VVLSNASPERQEALLEREDKRRILVKLIIYILYYIYIVDEDRYFCFDNEKWGCKYIRELSVNTFSSRESYPV